MKAIIYQPSRSMMQAGLKKSKVWCLKFTGCDKSVDRLTGWTSSCDTKQQVRIKFETKELAIDFVKRNNIDYEVQEPEKKIFRPNIYANNFK